MTPKRMRNTLGKNVRVKMIIVKPKTQTIRELYVINPSTR